VSERGIRVDSSELRGAVEELASDVAAMPSTWAAVGEALLPGVRERTPVRSGALRDSWTAAGEADRATIGSELPYAGVVEAINAPVADTLAASEAVISATLEEEIARQARSIGFEVRR
jgi:hypothetical protein